MAIVTVANAKAYLRVSDDFEDEVVERMIDAAQNHIERLLGYRIEATYGGAAQDPIPPALGQAVCQIVAHWYDTRGAVGEPMQELPFGVAEIVNEYREFTF